jgi:hypothetical protein
MTINHKDSEKSHLKNKRPEILATPQSAIVKTRIVKFSFVGNLLVVDQPPRKKVTVEVFF